MDLFATGERQSLADRNGLDSLLRWALIGPKLQRFTLANDSTTMAVEIAVGLARDDITRNHNAPDSRAELAAIEKPASVLGCGLGAHR
jgi:hypothetical protein